MSCWALLGQALTAYWQEQEKREHRRHESQMLEKQLAQDDRRLMCQYQAFCRFMESHDLAVLEESTQLLVLLEALESTSLPEPAQVLLTKSILSIVEKSERRLPTMPKGLIP